MCIRDRDFMWGFEGVTHEKDGGGVQFNGEMADLEATYLVGKVKAKVHPFVAVSYTHLKDSRNPWPWSNWKRNSQNLQRLWNEHCSVRSFYDKRAGRRLWC